MSVCSGGFLIIFGLPLSEGKVCPTTTSLTDMCKFSRTFWKAGRYVCVCVGEGDIKIYFTFGEQV